MLVCDKSSKAVATLGRFVLAEAATVLVRVARSGCSNTGGGDHHQASGYDYGGEFCFEVSHDIFLISWLSSSVCG